MGGISSPWNFLVHLSPPASELEREIQREIAGEGGLGTVLVPAGVQRLHQPGLLPPPPSQQTPARTCQSPCQGSRLVNYSLAHPSRLDRITGRRSVGGAAAQASGGGLLEEIHPGKTDSAVRHAPASQPTQQSSPPHHHL